MIDWLIDWQEPYASQTTWPKEREGAGDENIHPTFNLRLLTCLHLMCGSWRLKGATNERVLRYKLRTLHRSIRHAPYTFFVFFFFFSGNNSYYVGFAEGQCWCGGKSIRLPRILLPNSRTGAGWACGLTILLREVFLQVFRLKYKYYNFESFLLVLPVLPSDFFTPFIWFDLL